MSRPVGTKTDEAKRRDRLAGWIVTLLMTVGGWLLSAEAGDHPLWMRALFAGSVAMVTYALVRAAIDARRA